MEKNKKNEELQSRRSFFKTAVKGILPVLGVMALAGTPQNVNAVSPLEDSMGCNVGCSSGCYIECYTTCRVGCSGCKGGCQGQCTAQCSRSCSGGCSVSSRGIW